MVIPHGPQFIIPIMKCYKIKSPFQLASLLSPDILLYSSEHALGQSVPGTEVSLRTKPGLVTLAGLSFFTNWIQVKLNARFVLNVFAKITSNCVRCNFFFQWKECWDENNSTIPTTPPYLTIVPYLKHLSTSLTSLLEVNWTVNKTI